MEGNAVAEEASMQRQDSGAPIAVGVASPLVEAKHLDTQMQEKEQSTVSPDGATKEVLPTHVSVDEVPSARQQPAQPSSEAQPTHSQTSPHHEHNPPDSPARSESPVPSVAPSLALDAVPSLDQRSVSTPSSSEGSTLSTRSRWSRRSDAGANVVHRRGYMRPQGTSFADSARNRDSVMSLGSIAHMQYYFARTGLLDGKGGQLAKSRKPSNMNLRGAAEGKENVEPTSATESIYDFGVTSSMSTLDASSNYAVSDSGLDGTSVVESPSELHASVDAWRDPSDPIMLPPTVSTYKVKPEYTEPVPDLPVLRRELKEALQDACKVLEESQKPVLIDGAPPAENSGFYEVQGLHLLDIITLAIRAAKNYYTAHTAPYKLYAIRSEKLIRADLYQVLDILKRMAARNFRGGMRIMELAEIITWIESIDKLLKREEAQEQQDAAERESWVWLKGDDWAGREREREWMFLKSFDAMQPSLPQWPETSASAGQSQPTAFLLAFQDGQRLVRLHNALVARSKRRFGEIKSFHTDVAKPYRITENLQYWIKAAELRWDVLLSFPIVEIVNSATKPASAEAWRAFDEAIFRWARAVRTELTEEWLHEARMLERKKPPELKIEPAEGEAAPAAPAAPEAAAAVAV